LWRRSSRRGVSAALSSRRLSVSLRLAVGCCSLMFAPGAIAIGGGGVLRGGRGGVAVGRDGGIVGGGRRVPGRIGEGGRGVGIGGEGGRGTIVAGRGCCPREGRVVRGRGSARSGAVVVGGAVAGIGIRVAAGPGIEASVDVRPGTGGGSVRPGAGWRVAGSGLFGRPVARRVRVRAG